ncbi:GNAT family N-acetyltransferase [Ruegeria arenilitoris]|uniref:GNAT family N-acetyltransferase n=1 Tax=Ruegeria arenilitoris TaxID=1173585 RepID=UPI0034648FA5
MQRVGNIHSAACDCGATTSSKGIMTKSPVAQVAGPNLRLRLITPADAPYVHALRTNPHYNRHLSPVTGTVADQRKWIEGYKAEEAQCRQLYYVIERHDSTRCGLVRLYNIEKDQFTWGSWILDANKPRKAALESAVLSFGIGFDHLDLGIAKVDVRVENTHAEAFYRRLGMIETNRTAQDIFFDYPRNLFEESRVTYLQLLKG